MSDIKLHTNEIARLRSVVTDYERQFEAVANLLARLRNEINNPLAALLGHTQLLLREELSKKSRVRAEMIENEAKRIAKLVSELQQAQTWTIESIVGGKKLWQRM